jgi:Spy/CpxP family protein refolding chaperone
MRARYVMMLFSAVTVMTACGSSESVEPATTPTELIDLVPDYAVSPATSVDAAGIGAARFPEAIRLTVEQKAAIAALHEAFTKATAGDVAALRAIEREARTAIAAGKSREEVRAILARAQPIRERLDAAFRKLQADIWAVYTPEQRAWIESNRPRVCDAPLRLTDDQAKQIRTLQEQFVASVKPDLELIRSIAEEARKAREAGKSRQEVAAILEKGTEAHRRIAAAEQSLQSAILALLTPEQQRAWLCRHR